MYSKIINGGHGVYEALYGLGLSYGKTSDMTSHPIDGVLGMIKVANRLAHKQGGHNKFLESVVFWIDIRAPRFWWQEFDTYRVGVTKQSESTMHTITKRRLTQDDFEYPLAQDVLDRINADIDAYNRLDNDGDKSKALRAIKNALPEGFLQRRVVCINARTLQNMYMQRKRHRLVQWRIFFRSITRWLDDHMGVDDVKYWIFGGGEEGNSSTTQPAEEE